MKAKEEKRLVSIMSFIMKIHFFLKLMHNCTIFSTGQGGSPPCSGSTGEGYSRV
jgi:hypothetical protein